MSQVPVTEDINQRVGLKERPVCGEWALNVVC